MPLNEGARFCSGYGTPVPQLPVAPVCQQCQTELPEGARFCAQCGTSVPEPQVEFVEKFDFTAEGESVGYITLDQAVLQAKRLARENDREYCQRLGWGGISWSERSSERREDSYRVVLQFQIPVLGVKEEHIGQEEFLLDLTGILRDRQVLVWPVTVQEQARATAEEASRHIDGADYQVAIERLNEAIQLDPNYAHAYFLRSFAYHRRGEQVNEAENRKRTRPGDIPLVFGSPFLSSDARADYERAIRDYTKGIQLDPNNPWGYKNRGFAYQALGQDSKAQQDWDKARSLGIE